MENQFLVAALDDQGAWSTPVRVRCQLCGDYSQPFGTAEQAGEALLDDLNIWRDKHSCGPALGPNEWAAGGKAIVEYMEKAEGGTFSVDDGVKAFALALQAAWPALKACALAQAKPDPAE